MRANATWILGMSLALAPLAAHSGGEASVPATAVSLPHCGAINAPPYGSSADAVPRTCAPKTKRTYVPRHKGIGFEILDSESEACFVPDRSYQLLDEMVGAVLKDIKFDPNVADPKAEVDQIRAISRRVSEELKRRGFGLWVPTENLGDSLEVRNQPNEPERHTFDCDTGSFVFLTVVENIGASASLVDITLPSGEGHNYVQWKLRKSQGHLNWDLNQQGECQTPPNLPGHEGVPLSRDAARGYALALRAELWKADHKYEAALEDFRSSMKLYSQGTIGYNNFAWLVATREFPDRREHLPAALDAANHLVAMNRIANYLDTLACVHALAGNFSEAVKLETEAVEKSGKPSFKIRLAKFRQQLDCTGDE